MVNIEAFLIVTENSPKPAIVSAHRQFNYVKFQNETYGSINAIKSPRRRASSASMTAPRADEILIDISPPADTKSESSKRAETKKPVPVSPSISIIDLPIGEGMLRHCIRVINNAKHVVDRRYLTISKRRDLCVVFIPSDYRVTRSSLFVMCTEYYTNELRFYNCMMETEC